DANVNLEGVVAERTQDLSQALDDLRLQQAQLIQSEKMASLGQMVAGVAHEINTPLGYANSNVSIVRELVASMEEQIDGESREEFDMLLGDAQYGLEQIAELVMSLKNFSRVDRSHTELFDLNDGVETSLKICQNQIKDLVVEKQFAELPDISCAPSQLNQVFLNLINNAAQAMGGQGTLTVTTERDGDNAVVKVRDTGCGMDADTVAHIFEPFFTTKPVGEGTGLGLSIVFRIIEDHGGQITVESQPGEGTEFRVSLPISAASQPAGDVVTEESVILSESEA
ncbi:MAG: HAMP domain-containing histidine kinase, partial [Spongiibacter sp.]